MPLPKEFLFFLFLLRNTSKTGRNVQNSNFRDGCVGTLRNNWTQGMLSCSGTRWAQFTRNMPKECECDWKLSVHKTSHLCSLRQTALKFSTNSNLGKNLLVAVLKSSHFATSGSCLPWRPWVWHNTRLFFCSQTFVLITDASVSRVTGSKVTGYLVGTAPLNNFMSGNSLFGS